MAHLRPSSRRAANPPKPPGSWRWSRSSSSPRTSPIVRRPTPCAPAWTGRVALSLELSDPGFDASVLSEFRTRLLDGGAGELLLDTLLARFRQLGLLKACGRQRTDSTHVLAAVRALNRLELVREAMRHALDVLADVAPDWLAAHARVEWVKRYRRRCDEERLPKDKEAQREQADQIGRDGMELLEAVSSADAPS
jgi:transposase